MTMMMWNCMMCLKIICSGWGWSTIHAQQWLGWMIGRGRKAFILRYYEYPVWKITENFPWLYFYVPRLIANSPKYQHSTICNRTHRYCRAYIQSNNSRKTPYHIQNITEQNTHLFVHKWKASDKMNGNKAGPIRRVYVRVPMSVLWSCMYTSKSKQFWNDNSNSCKRINRIGFFGQVYNACVCALEQCK